MPKNTKNSLNGAMLQSFASRPPLTEEDCNFSSVRLPDVELVPCLLFEFLRESPTVRKLEQDLIEKKQDSDKLFKQLRALRFNINHHIDIPGFISFAVHPDRGTMDLLKTPWQKLDLETKEQLIYFCNGVDKAAFISTSDFETGEIFKKMRLDFLHDMRAFESNNQAPSTAYASAPLDFLDNYKGRTIFGVVVDFWRYDDNAIKAELLKVIEEIIKNRPKKIKPQFRKESGHGRTAEWRGTLNSLGLARLASRFYAQQLQTQMPSIYKQIAKPLSDKGTTAVQKKLDSARDRFVVRFHKMLPFEKLPPLCLRQSRSAK